MCARHIEQYTKSSILWPTASQHIDISLKYEPYVFHIVVKKSNTTYILSSTQPLDLPLACHARNRRFMNNTPNVTLPPIPLDLLSLLDKAQRKETLGPRFMRARRKR